MRLLPIEFARKHSERKTPNPGLRAWARSLPALEFCLDLQNAQNKDPIPPILSVLGYWANMLGSFGGSGGSLSLVSGSLTLVSGSPFLGPYPRP